MNYLINLEESSTDAIEPKIQHMKKLYKLLFLLKQRGLKATSFKAFLLIYDLYFDIKYGIDTNSWVSVDELGVEENTIEHAKEYHPTRVIPLRKLFKKLSIPKDYSLVDIGCGKGRVLLVAAEYGFEEVKGIEFSPLLCSIAEENIYKYKQKNQPKTLFQVINADAANYQYQDDEDIFFLYNPFDEIMLEKVLQNITTSLKRHNRSVWMIYANAMHRELIEKTMNITNIEEFNIFEFQFVVYEIELGRKKIFNHG